MIKLKSPQLLIIFGLALMLLAACGDNCDGLDCGNGIAVETEISCNCDCSGTFYIGINCETFDPSQVQGLLDDGKRPLELLEGGIPIDSIYDKRFEDGLIFYLDAFGTGMLAAMSDMDNEAVWGCMGTDIDGLNNVDSGPPNNSNDPETLEGARVGDGFNNTNLILAECSTNGIAAKLCRDLGPDWFLPSRGEFDLMKRNLSYSFSDNPYWLSTEHSGFEAWYSGEWRISKEAFKKVRAARAF